MNYKMSISAKCSGLCVNEVNELVKVIPSPSVLSEINAVIERMDTRPDTEVISVRVCQSLKWKQALSATRWPSLSNS